MFKHLSALQRGIIVFTFIFLANFSNYYLNYGSQVSACFCIAIGFAIGFYFFMENKILYTIVIGFLASHIIARLLYTDLSFMEILLKSLGQTAVSIFVIVAMKKISFAFEMASSIKLKSTIVFFLSSVLISFVAGVLISNMMMLGSNSNDIFRPIIKWSTGYFFGINTYGIAIIYSNFYKERFMSSFKKNLYATIYLSMFTLVSIILFSQSIPGFTYGDFSYIFILFYIVLSLVFSYRMIVVSDVIFIVVFQFFYINLGSSNDYIYIIFHVNLYLLVLSTMASTLKMVIYELNIRNTALIRSSSKLESLVYSTDSLLKLSDDILNTDVKVQENYLSRIFKIACNIFDNYDYAACYIKEGEYANFVDAVGYDTKVLNSFYFKSKDLNYIDTNNPIHVPRAEKEIRLSLKDKYSEYTKIYPKIGEAIRFGIYIDENTIANISFDITVDSNKKFLRNEFESLQSFQKLMNSFFSINYLNYKNISLKNDIVLSLIRTLELYDQYTGGHSEEVAYLSNEIARRCHLSEYDMHDIYWAGVVHDIGKVGIDSKIINKPSKLSLEEYEIIKEHAMFGYDILNKAEDLKHIALLVKHHHEWWNGAGYPDGLKGEDIPLGSQILSVCDAVSTMAKKRPYTIVKTSREIIEELTMYKGVQFSPKPTEEMIKFIEEGLLDSYYKNR